jgi:hypothetical protein
VLTLLREPQLITKKHLEREEALLQEIASGMVKIAKGCGKIVATAVVEHGAEHRQRLSELHTLRQRTPRIGEAALASTPCDEPTARFIDHAIGCDTQIKTMLRSARCRTRQTRPPAPR